MKEKASVKEKNSLFVQDSQEIANKIKNSTLEIMRGAHVPMWEIPEQYTDLIVKFLSN